MEAPPLDSVSAEETLIIMMTRRTLRGGHRFDDPIELIKRDDVVVVVVVVGKLIYLFAHFSQTQTITSALSMVWVIYGEPNYKYDDENNQRRMFRCWWWGRRKRKLDQTDKLINHKAKRCLALIRVDGSERPR